MYIDPLKNVRFSINNVIGNVEISKSMAIKQSLKPKYQLDIINRNNINLFSDFKVDFHLNNLIEMNFNLRNSFSSLTFQRNLFSEETIKSFKELYRFDDEIVLQAQQTIRDFYINPTAISTLAEAINSTYPINEQSTYKRHDEFVKRIENDFPHPFKKLIRWSNGIAAGADIQIFVTNYINENDLHIQNSLIVAIVCLLSFLSTYCSHSKK
ncbi:hypothetical protein [Staphylococcus aureus]|uniref:hypothetical protein n=1 Tax=Staphylococcus aureus TaxID=1280 RepID=UPI0022B5CE92|nr:hypothetical protein [Staphylococcus aureus]MCZ4814768.1 hypothetical protein [Staphylococcus aureus]